MSRQQIYLDNNSTTFLDPRVAARLNELLAAPIANPASQHAAGRRALSLLEQAKHDLLAHIDAPRVGMDSANVILTSGGTESNNLILHGTDDRESFLIVGSADHPSVLECARQFPQHRVRYLPVDPCGRYDVGTLESWLNEIYASGSKVALVSLLHGNNETGVLQDLKAICSVCSTYGVPVHSDIVQSVGKISFSMREIGLAAVSVCAHKLHGPLGVGALVIRSDLKLNPLLFGGGQQLELRPGTESVPLAVAFAYALELTILEQKLGAYEHVRSLRKKLEVALNALPRTLPLETFIVGAENDPSARLPHTVNVAFVGLDRQAVQMALDLAGLACSTGSACASGSGRPSHVLLAMGLPPDVVRGSIRLSLSRFTTIEEIDSACEILAKVLGKAVARQ